MYHADHEEPVLAVPSVPKPEGQPFTVTDPPADDPAPAFIDCWRAYMEGARLDGHWRGARGRAVRVGTIVRTCWMRLFDSNGRFIAQHIHDEYDERHDGLTPSERKASEACPAE